MQKKSRRDVMMRINKENRRGKRRADHLSKLFSLGCVNGANISAGTAFSAKLLVNDCLTVFYLDGFNGTLVRACTASDALITYFVCHVLHPPMSFYMYDSAEKGVRKASVTIIQ